MISRFRGLLICSVIGITTAATRAALPPAATTFIQRHCADCHNSDAKKGNLDLSALPFDLNTQATFDRWVKIHDRVEAGEMPPKSEKRPAAAESTAFLKAIADPMIQADQAREATQGRAVWRRLNRYEYENAMRDLLGAPWLQIKELLPEDGESHRFNKDGTALSISHVQMAAYLDAAEYALHEVAGTQASRPETTTTRYYAREQKSFVNKMEFTVFNHSSERATMPLLGEHGQPEVLAKTAPITVGAKDPAVREQEAFGVVASSYEPLEMTFNGFSAKVSGHYKLRFKGYTFWDGPVSEEKWWVPSMTKASRGHRDEPVTIYSETRPRLLRLLGSFDFKPDPSVHELDVYMLAGETIRPDAARLFRSRPPNWHNPLAEKDGCPGVAFQWMEAEGPIYDQWPTAGQRLLYGQLPTKDPASPGEAVQVLSQKPHDDAHQLLSNFMQKAYRRPVGADEVQRFAGVVDHAMSSGESFSDAMEAGYSAVLCSPDFVCIEEQPGKLDDFALAERLAFFLWNSPPDDQLRKLAIAKTLHVGQTLGAQVERMLSDPKSRRFQDAFLDYWLDLRKLVATAPDSTVYPDYYLDDLLTESADRETRLFFNDLVDHDLPSSNIVSSDFTYLNERLAKLYGIPGVTGVAMRRVELPANSLRGGFMTQASVLKVTANGTTTSPVLRGAWIMERVLGKPPPPPPPNVPAIEPDIRGATTIRAQLEAHRKLASCAACHAKIDPAGFALENFDVMGGFRDDYRALGEGQRVKGYGHGGQTFEFHIGQPVDASSVLPDGRHFQNVTELKKLLLADQRQIARNLAQQLVVYGTGAAVQFGDRPQVEAILDHSAAKNYGVRTIIKEVVMSDLFQMK
jgi:hypothetical protein